MVSWQVSGSDVQRCLGPKSEVKWTSLGWMVGERCNDATGGCAYCIPCILLPPTKSSKEVPTLWDVQSRCIQEFYKGVLIKDSVFKTCGVFGSVLTCVC